MNTSAKTHNIIRKVSAALFAAILVIGEITPVYAGSKVNYDDENYVVVLDPGHDSKHSGASGYGLQEEVLTLKIAMMCKEELEKNENVTVYLTHDTLSCPFYGSTSSECNKQRCEYAASLGADILVSIHINSAVEKYKNGFEIYYPTSNYVPQFHETGYELSSFVANQLKKVISRYNGMYTRDSDENKMNDENFYPDGTRADYYNVIRNSKYNNIVGIIVEHGYISNRYDAVNYLKGDEALYRLAKADADGIMDFLNSISARTEIEKRRKQALDCWNDEIIHISGYLLDNSKDNSFYAQNISVKINKPEFKTAVATDSLTTDSITDALEPVLSEYSAKDAKNFGIMYFDLVN